MTRDFTLLLLVPVVISLIQAGVTVFLKKVYSEHRKFIFVIELIFMMTIGVLVVYYATLLSIVALPTFLIGIGFMAFFLHLASMRLEGYEHEFVEGMTFGSSFSIHPEIGAIAAFMIATHKSVESSLVALPFLEKDQPGEAFVAVILRSIVYIVAGAALYFISRTNYLTAAGFSGFSAGCILYLTWHEWNAGKFLEQKARRKRR